MLRVAELASEAGTLMAFLMWSPGQVLYAARP